MKAGVDVNYLRNESRWDLFFPARIIFPSLAAFQTFTPAVFWWPYLITASSHPGVSPAWTDDVPPAWADATRFTLNHSSYGFFAQDHWQAADRLSLTYGLRYDIEAYPSAFIVKKDLNNVQPRMGGAFAYSAHGVVRGGYGVFFDRLASSVGQLFNATQWSSAGSLPNAQKLFPTIAPIQGRFQQRTAGGALAPIAARTFLTTGQVPTTSTLGLADTLDGAVRRLVLDEQVGVNQRRLDALLKTLRLLALAHPPRRSELRVYHSRRPGLYECGMRNADLKDRFIGSLSQWMNQSMNRRINESIQPIRIPQSGGPDTI